MYRFFSLAKHSVVRRKVNLKSTITQRIRNAGLWNDTDLYGIDRIAALYILCFVVTNVTQIIALFMSANDSTKLFECFSVLSFCMMGFLKLWTLQLNQKQWRFIIDRAASLEYDQLNNYDSPNDYESDDETGYSFSDHIKSYTGNFLMISTLLSRIYSFTAVVFMASPFIEYGIYKFGGQNIDLPHILPGWAPLDRHIIGYLATVLAEAVAAIYCVKLHLAFDLTTVGLMIFIRGQFTSLHKYSERIGGTGKSLRISKKKDARAHYRIKQCHSIHVLLIKSITELGKLIKNILGIYFFVATLTLCSVAIQLNWEQVSFTQLVSLLQYMGATMTQLFLFCHYGDGILNESSIGLGKGPFCAACWCLNPKIRREIAILGVGMARSYRMHAGPFNSLDLASFIQILRTAYSYYAVIRQTSE